MPYGALGGALGACCRPMSTMPFANRRPRAAVAVVIVAAVAVGASTTGCASQRPEAEAVSASASAPTRQTSAQTEVDARVQAFLSSISDRQKLMQRTGAESPGRAILAAAERFYAEHRKLLHRAFEDSLRELPGGPPPSTERARLVGTIDAPAPAETDQLRRMARFQLAVEPDVRKRAKRALNQIFVPLAAEQAHVPVARAAELQVFFSLAEPSYSRCGERRLCVGYGATDTFVISFQLVDDELWVEDQFAWWTTAAPEGAGTESE